MRDKLFIGMLAVCLSLTGQFAHAKPTRVNVVDGDTIKIDSQTYRLHGIDAPEAGQKCSQAGSQKEWGCGKAAISHLEEMVLGKVIRCDNRGSDQYGRVISVCTADGKDINATMVSSGYAWAYRKYSLDYVEQEDKARLNKLGVFQTQTQSPWEYRSEKWSTSSDNAPEGCPIKGNISQNGRIYHTPWSPFYSRTKINTKKGERWFCNEAEALASGWRAPRWGR